MADSNRRNGARERAIALAPCSLVGHYNLAKTLHRVGTEESARLALSELRMECDRAIEERDSQLAAKYLQLIEEGETNWEWKSPNGDQ